ncbi:DUF2760 domain-containing protein [Candidatus Entotheonella serta]|nr:DUF2760 domain-containing protein [Candidatus Entotheonella serta]
MIGLGKRTAYAFKSFFAILSRGEIPDDVLQELVKPPDPDTLLPAPDLSAPEPEPATPPPEPEVPAAELTDRAVQLLALLQRDGRLIDFFSENITPFSDAQVGAAARNVHESCRQTLERYITLEPVIDSQEGQSVTVQEDFDPSTTKLVGNVTGQPPLRGVLRHHGWRATHVDMPPLPPEGLGRTVVAPAEVEIP